MKSSFSLLPVLCAFGVIASWCPAAKAASVTILSTQEAEYDYNGSAFVSDPNLGDIGFVGGNGSNGQDDARYALQFLFPSFPAGASITSASLQLLDATLPHGSTVLEGFDGNGTFSSSSVQGGTDLQTFIPHAGAPFSVDVTSFIDSVPFGDEAGFYLRQSPLQSVPDMYDTNGAASPPQLTVIYTVPTAAPEPATLALLAVPLALGLCLKRRPR